MLVSRFLKSKVRIRYLTSSTLKNLYGFWTLKYVSAILQDMSIADQKLLVHHYSYLYKLHMLNTLIFLEL